MKDKQKYEIPALKHPRSGLSKQGCYYMALYYEGGKLKKKSTRSKSLRKAQEFRNHFYQRLLEQGAVFKGRKKKVVEQAKQNPDGMSGIYKVVGYRVVVDGVNVINTTSKEKAIEARNKYIEENY